MKRVFPLFLALFFCVIFTVVALAQAQTGTAKQNANLRAGPGKTYTVTGQASTNQTLTIVSKNADGTWLQLDTGQWIAASLVNVAATPVTAAPPNNTVGRVEAQVVKIVDGDTIDVSISGQTYRLRYILMNTPEANQPMGSEATEANRRLVEGKTVYLVKDVSETDRYGRLLRYVYLADGTFVNAELVRQGYATLATFPPDVSKQAEVQAAQQEAVNTDRGLWAAQPGAGQAAQPAQPVAASPTAVRNSNLRAGPGTGYQVVGSASAGQQLSLTGRNDAGNWYQLSSGAWIAASLVSNAPGGLQVVAAPAPVQVSSAAIASVAPVAPPQQAASACDPNYAGACIPIVDYDLDCGDIYDGRFQVVGVDHHRFDGDGDGIGCESN